MTKKIVGGVVVDLTPEEQAEHDAIEAVLAEERIRKTKISEIKAEGLSRISGQLPDVDTFDEVDTLRKFGPAFQLSATGQTVKDIYVYARGRITLAQTAPIDQVEAYDPAADPNWPA